MNDTHILILDIKNCIPAVHDQLHMFLEPVVGGNVYWGENLTPLLHAGRTYYTPKRFELGLPLKFRNSADLIVNADILDETGTVIVPEVGARMLPIYGTFIPKYHPKTIELILAYIDFTIAEYTEFTSQRRLDYLKFFRYIDTKKESHSFVTAAEDDVFANYCETLLFRALDFVPCLRDFITRHPWNEYSVEQIPEDPYKIHVTREEDYRITWFHKHHNDNGY